MKQWRCSRKGNQDLCKTCDAVRKSLIDVPSKIYSVSFLYAHDRKHLVELSQYANLAVPEENRDGMLVKVRSAIMQRRTSH